MLTVMTVLFIQAVNAEEGKTRISEQSTFTLGEVVVATDSETPVDTDNHVDEQKLRQFNRDTLADALDLLPGVTLSRTGSRNEQTVYVRGFDIKHVPIFIDGIPVYVMYDGYPDLGRFSTFDLSRVILSKGFASVLYGPNTMGGAINMVSKRPENALEMNAGVGAASGDTCNAYINLGSNQGNWYIQGGGAYVDQDYFPLSYNFNPASAEGGDRRENSYHTDWKANLKIGYVPGGRNDDEYAFSYIRQEGEKGSPPYAGADASQKVRYWQWPQWDKESYYFTSRTGIGETGYVKMRLYYDTYNNSLFSYDDDTYSTISRPYAFRSWYDDHTSGGSMEAGARFFEDHDLKLAFHYKKDTHKERDEGQPWRTFEDDIYSLGVEDTMDMTSSLRVVAGASYDTIQSGRAEEYDFKTDVVSVFPDADASGANAQAGLFYSISDNGVLHTTVARKTRLPDMKSRYSYRFGTALPNPGLDPETAVNYEIGYKDTLVERIQIKAAIFCNDIRDYIQFARVPDPNDPDTLLNQNQNVGKVLIYGAEAEAGVKITETIETGLNYTYTEWDNRSNSDKVTNIPNHKFFAYLAYQPFDRLNLQTNIDYVSRRYGSTDGVRVAERYVVADAKALYQLTKSISAEAGLNNIGDTDYEIEEGYPEAGITYFANLMYRY